MEKPLLSKLKIIVLKKIDLLLWRQHRQTLGELVNELYLRHLSAWPDPTADEIFALLQNNRVLSTLTDPEAKGLRDTVQRFVAGTYGSCLDCGQDIGDSELETNPTQQWCARCLQSHDRSYSVLLDAMKSVSDVPWYESMFGQTHEQQEMSS